MKNYKLDYLDHLESEAIHIMREVAGQFEVIQIIQFIITHIIYISFFYSATAVVP